jgi:hypothetical protein
MLERFGGAPGEAIILVTENHSRRQARDKTPDAQFQSSVRGVDCQPEMTTCESPEVTNIQHSDFETIGKPLL